MQTFLWFNIYRWFNNGSLDINKTGESVAASLAESLVIETQNDIQICSIY